MTDDFAEGVFHEEKILTGGLRENIKYWVRKDGEAFILEYLRLDGAMTGMEAERLTAEDFEKRFEKTPEVAPEEEKTPEEIRQEKVVRQGEIHPYPRLHGRRQFAPLTQYSRSPEPAVQFSPPVRPGSGSTRLVGGPTAGQRARIRLCRNRRPWHQSKF